MSLLESDVCACTLVTFHMTRSCVCWYPFKCVTWLTHMWDMRDSYVWHDAFICVAWLTWLIHMGLRIHCYVRHAAFMCVTPARHAVYESINHHTSDVNHSYISQDLFMRVTWHIHVCHTCSTNCMWVYTPSHVWRKSFMCVVGLICMGDMTHSYVSHLLLDTLHVSLQLITRLTELTHICLTTRLYGWHDAFTRATPARHTACESINHHSSDINHSCNVSGLIHVGDMTRSCVAHLLDTLHVSLQLITRLT